MIGRIWIRHFERTQFRRVKEVIRAVDLSVPLNDMDITYDLVKEGDIAAAHDIETRGMLLRVPSIPLLTISLQVFRQMRQGHSLHSSMHVLTTPLACKHTPSFADTGRVTLPTSSWAPIHRPRHPERWWVTLRQHRAQTQITRTTPCQLTSQMLHPCASTLSVSNHQRDARVSRLHS